MREIKLIVLFAALTSFCYIDTVNGSWISQFLGFKYPRFQQRTVDQANLQKDIIETVPTQFTFPGFYVYLRPKFKNPLKLVSKEVNERNYLRADNSSFGKNAQKNEETKNIKTSSKYFLKYEENIARFIKAKDNGSIHGKINNATGDIVEEIEPTSESHYVKTKFMERFSHAQFLKKIFYPLNSPFRHSNSNFSENQKRPERKRREVENQTIPLNVHFEILNVNETDSINGFWIPPTLGFNHSDFQQRASNKVILGDDIVKVAPTPFTAHSDELKPRIKSPFKQLSKETNETKDIKTVNLYNRNTETDSIKTGNDVYRKHEEETVGITVLNASDPFHSKIDNVTDMAMRNSSMTKNKADFVTASIHVRLKLEFVDNIFQMVLLAFMIMLLSMAIGFLVLLRGLFLIVAHLLYGLILLCKFFVLCCYSKNPPEDRHNIAVKASCGKIRLHRTGYSKLVSEPLSV